MFSETSSLSQLIRMRPIVIEYLETARHPFWHHLDMTIESFCRETDLDLADLLDVAEKSPVPQANLDWSQERSYRIADFLVAEHRQFRHEDLPLFNRLFSQQGSGDYPDAFGKKFAHQTFRSFEESLLEHMYEEEEHVFPYILRLEEACNFNRDAGFNVTHHISATMIASLGHVYEQHLDRLALNTGTLKNEMEDFKNRMLRHASLETEVLFPRAKAMEKRLEARRNILVFA